MGTRRYTEEHVQGFGCRSEIFADSYEPISDLAPGNDKNRSVEPQERLHADLELLLNESPIDIISTLHTSCNCSRCKEPLQGLRPRSYKPPSHAVACTGTQQLERIKYSDPKFKKIDTYFRNTWSHSDRKLTNVGYIYRISCATASIASAYNQYMHRVGNTKRRWHGTSRKCCLGDDPHNLKLCNDSDCSVCQIIRAGYKQSRARPSGLFGKGIYCTSTSSKAAKYSRTKKRSKYDVVFLNNIVLGKEYLSPQPLCNYTGPPAGYDSAYGKAGYTSTNAGTLQYDEMCVYDDNAIRPTYLVLFTQV